MTGWGQIRNTSVNDMNFKEFGVRSKILKRTRLPIANSKCTETEGEFKIDPNLQYCAGGIKGKLTIILANVFKKHIYKATA